MTEQSDGAVTLTQTPVRIPLVRRFEHSITQMDRVVVWVRTANPPWFPRGRVRYYNGTSKPRGRVSGLVDYRKYRT